MVPTLTTVAVSALIGVLIGAGVHETFGGKRSTVGVHRRNGQLLSFWPGVVFFSLIMTVASLVTTVVSSAITSALPGIVALIFAILAVSVFLNISSYSR